MLECALLDAHPVPSGKGCRAARGEKKRKSNVGVVRKATHRGVTKRAQECPGGDRVCHRWTGVLNIKHWSLSYFMLYRDNHHGHATILAFSRIVSFGCFSFLVRISNDLVRGSVM